MTTIFEKLQAQYLEKVNSKVEKSQKIRDFKTNKNFFDKRECYIISNIISGEQLSETQYKKNNKIYDIDMQKYIASVEIYENLAKCGIKNVISIEKWDDSKQEYIFTRRINDIYYTCLIDSNGTIQEQETKAPQKNSFSFNR